MTCSGVRRCSRRLLGGGGASCRAEHLVSLNTGVVGSLRLAVRKLPCAHAALNNGAEESLTLFFIYLFTIANIFTEPLLCVTQPCHLDWCIPGCTVWAGGNDKHSTSSWGFGGLHNEIAENSQLICVHLKKTLDS